MTHPGALFQPYKLVTTTIRQAHTWPASIGDRPFSKHFIELPPPGFYQLHQVKGGPWVPLRIWLVEHRCPDTRALMADPEYMGQRGLEPPSSCWDWRFSNLGYDLTRIDRAEYDYLVRLFEHARDREQDLPEARPDRAVDWLNAPSEL